MVNRFHRKLIFRIMMVCFFIEIFLVYCSVNNIFTLKVFHFNLNFVLRLKKTSRFPLSFSINFINQIMIFPIICLPFVVFIYDFLTQMVCFTRVSMLIAIHILNNTHNHFTLSETTTITTSTATPLAPHCIMPDTVSSIIFIVHIAPISLLINLKGSQREKRERLTLLPGYGRCTPIEIPIILPSF